MKNTVSVVFEINLNKQTPWSDATKLAYAQIETIVNAWIGIANHCKESGCYAVVLNAQRDSATVAALLHWCEYGNFSYKAHWITDEWCVQKDWD